MDNTWPLIAIAIIVLLLLVGIMIMVYKNKKEIKTDYYTLFFMGLIWLPLGIPLKNYAFTAMGAVFLIIGLVNKDKWEKNHRKWEDLSSNQKKFKGILIGILTALVIAGIAVFVLAN